MKARISDLMLPFSSTCPISPTKKDESWPWPVIGHWSIVFVFFLIDFFKCWHESRSCLFGTIFCLQHRRNIPLLFFPVDYNTPLSRFLLRQGFRHEVLVCPSPCSFLPPNSPIVCWLPEKVSKVWFLAQKLLIFKDHSIK